MGLVRKRAGAGSGKKDGNLTEGPIGRGLFRFMIPIFLGQLLQQLYMQLLLQTFLLCLLENFSRLLAFHLIHLRIRGFCPLYILMVQTIQNFQSGW